jgi:hypothetical protein
MEIPNNKTQEYAGQAAGLERVISLVPSELISRRPAEDRWSALEIVCHLADAELLASARIRRIITQDRARLWGYQQELWASALGYRQQRIETVLARFVLLRRENAELIEGLAAEIWQQSGQHDMNGTFTLEQLIDDYLTHTAKHIEQIGKVETELAVAPTIERNIMAKTQDDTKGSLDVKGKDAKGAKTDKVLMKRVKKAVKKSRRKLSEQKFEKELDRTITFLAELQHRINHTHVGNSPEPQVAAEPSLSADKKGDGKSGNGKGKSKGKSKHKAKAEAKNRINAEVEAAAQSASGAAPEPAATGN